MYSKIRTLYYDGPTRRPVPTAFAMDNLQLLQTPPSYGHLPSGEEFNLTHSLKYFWMNYPDGSCTLLSVLYKRSVLYKISVAL